jgi:hypothetical protein
MCIFMRRNSLVSFYLVDFEQNVRRNVLRCIQNIQPGEKTKGDSSLLKT